MLSHPASARYGLIGLPLAFAAIPLYVVLPSHYGQTLGVSLGLLGLVFLLTRLADAFIDPLAGRWVDRLLSEGRRALGWMALAAVALVLGFVAVFFPPVRGEAALLWWCAGTIMFTFLAYSLATVMHLAWGTRLGGTQAQRSRISGWREGLALAGVLTAAVLPGTLGLAATVAAFAVLLALGWVAWRAAVVPTARGLTMGAIPRTHPLRQPRFLRLLAVFVVNGTASAVPATLVLFFVQDRLQAPASIEPAFLATYFLCAALSLPLWLRLVPRLGLARTWLAGMGLSVAVFIWAATLSTGDVLGFWSVCALSGLALGTDLALPGALLAGVIGDQGDRGQREGAYFGWWNLAAKLNLALAAGLALPLLARLGYTPGTRSEAGLQTLSLAYAVLPCLLKLAAAAALYLLVVRRTPGSAAFQAP